MVFATSALTVATAISLCASLLPAGAESLEAMKAREFLQKGNIHLTRLEFQAALDAYTECLLLEPNNRTAKENIVLTHNNWGIYWFQKRKYKEAREEWEQALKLNPADRNARNNMQILRVTLSRQGLTDEGEKKQPPAKANSDFPPSQAIILTPGIKSGNSANSAAGGESGSSTAPAIASPNTGSASDSAGTSDSGSGAAIIIRSSNSGSATTSGGGTAAGSSGVNSTGSSGGANGNNSAGTDNSAANATFSNTSGVSTYSDPAPGKFTTAPASTPSASATATAGGSQGDNIEDSLGQIELKIYGRKQDSLPIMKRLEKLETDTHGKTKSGTIKERIDTLRKSYGF